MPPHATPFTCSQCGSTETRGKAAGKCGPCYQRAYHAVHREARVAKSAAYRAAHLEERRAKNRVYAAEHRDELLAKKRAYYAANRERWQAYAASYREAKRHRDRLYMAKHREEARKRAAAWYWEHRECAQAYGAVYRAKREIDIKRQKRAYRLAHRDEQRERDRVRLPLRRDARREWEGRRRARKRNGYVAAVRFRAIYQRDGGVCQICKQPVARSEASLDHILPLACGGTHEPKNVQLAHRRCNYARQHRGPAQLRLLG